MISSSHEAQSRNGFTIPVSLHIGTRVIRTNTILDSGATTCFMDVLFGHTHSILLPYEMYGELSEGEET